MASDNSGYESIGESGMLKYARAHKLGEGGFAIVFRGFFNGRQVAVKRIQLHLKEEREVKLQETLSHQNVLSILKVEEDKDFRYIVLELCAGTMEQFIQKEYTGPMPSDEQVLYEIACGVQYLHSKKLIHRDINPKNILISCTNPVVMKISDFGLCKTTSTQGTFNFSSGIKGTENWLAAEILNLIHNINPKELNKQHGTVQSDIFAVGCVFFFFITRGIHPFGDNKYSIENNILNDNPVNLTNSAKEQFAYVPIDEMIRKKDDRIALTAVIKVLEQTFRQYRKYQFKTVKRSFPHLSNWCRSRFHPTKLVLACSSHLPTVILLKGANGSIPFSNWRIEHVLKRQTQSPISALEWNVNGTQLAAGCADGTVVVWSYPSGRVLFEEKKHSRPVFLIFWNPFRPEVLATHSYGEGALLFWNSQGENGNAEKANHFLTLQRQVSIWSVAWISAKQIAIGLENGEIEIWEIDEDKGSSQVVKRFRHSESEKDRDRAITDLQWNEGTKYLASCSYEDKWVKIWSMDSDQPVHTLQVDSNFFRLAWRRIVKTDNQGEIDGERKDKENFNFAGGLHDGSIVIWNPLEENEANRKRILPQTHSNSVWSVSFSPDGRLLSSADEKNELIIWSTQTWLPVFTYKNDSADLSWISTNSSSVPAYKLAVKSTNMVCVIEQSFTE